jgi:L-asparaginase II
MGRAQRAGEYAVAIELVKSTRGDLIETIHRGDIAVVDADGRLLWSAGDPGKVTYMRSAAKPIQATAAVESGALDRFGITPRELAVICASHNGEPFHVDAVLSILARIGLSEEALQCGTHPPGYVPAAVALYRSGASPSPVHNNCSGKHSGMLAAAVALGAPTETYLERDHPVQQRILHNVASYAGLSERAIVVAVDGCSAPVFGLPIFGMALMYARLASPQRLPPEQAAAARRIVAAMQGYPEMVGGTERFDTDLMAACRARLFAKGGAEGVHCVGVPALGLGVAVKIESGHGAAASVATMEVLRGLGVLDEAALARLAPYRIPDVRNVRGRVVGRMQPVFTYGA